jgi:hypothetical protein
MRPSSDASRSSTVDMIFSRDRPSAGFYIVGSFCQDRHRARDATCYISAMTKRRKATAKPRPQTRAEAEAWRALHRQLARTKTRSDAEKVAAQVPPPHTKRFYSNLRYFVRTLAPPRGATRSERFVYRKLRLRFSAAVGTGQVKPAS